jgi:hypothetical protein
VRPARPAALAQKIAFKITATKLPVRAAISRKEAVEARLAAAQLAVGVLVVDRLADGGLDQALGVEARLEMVQRVGLAAQAAAEVEALVAVRLCPARGLEQDERRGAGLTALVRRATEVVVQPRLARQAKRAGDGLALDGGVEADERQLARRSQ